MLKPLLGVLLVAREPLTARQLRAILNLDDERLRAGIARLGGLVADDGKQRYTLFHLKLYDYLRQDEKRPHKAYIFARDEEEGWHDTLARWCERGDLSLIWEPARHDPVEQGRREYARKYYVTHLYLSHEWQQPQKQRLFEVLDTVQYGQAKIRMIRVRIPIHSIWIWVGKQRCGRDGHEKKVWPCSRVCGSIPSSAVV